MSYPSIEGLVLEDQDRQVLQEIRDKLEAGNLLQRVLAIAAFLPLFDSSPVAAVSIAASDWTLWAGVVKDAPRIAKRSAREVAQYRLLSVTNHNKREHMLFWRAIVRSLQ